MINGERAALAWVLVAATLMLAGRAEAQAGALGTPARAGADRAPAEDGPAAAPDRAAPVAADSQPADGSPADASGDPAAAEEAGHNEAAPAGGADDLLPEPAPERAAASRALDAPVAPAIDARRAAMQLANLELEELALAREHDAIGGDRTLAAALYVGGIGLTVGSVAMLVMAILQGACVSEELGCYDAPQYVIGGVPVALVSALIMSGASMTDSRVGVRERALGPRRDALQEQRRRVERRVGLAIGPGARLAITF